MRHQPVDTLAARSKFNPGGLLFDNGTFSATNEDAYLFTKKLARYFEKLGVKSGDIVGLNMPPSLYLYFLLATWHQTAIATNYTKQIARENAWQPEWIFSTVEFEPNLGKSVVLITQKIIEEIEKLEPLEKADSYSSIDSPIALIFSSGTTGKPKSFSLSMGNLESRMPVYFDETSGYKGSLVLLDVSTAAGFGSFYAELRVDGCYLMPSDSGTNVGLVIKHGTRSILGSPNQIAEFLQAAAHSESSRFSIEKVLVTGASLSSVVALQVKSFFNCQIINSYGSSEAGLVSARSDNSTNPFDLGNVIEGILVQVVDEDDQPVPEGITGKIRAKSPSITPGYFRDNPSTSIFFKDGWFYSGDLVHFEGGGRLFLDGRSSELINVGGVKIDPAKIDDLVRGKFGVVDAGAFGFRDAGGAEKFGLAVVISQELDEKELSNLILEFYGTKFPITIYPVQQIKRNSRGKTMRLQIASDFKNL